MAVSASTVRLQAELRMAKSAQDASMMEVEEAKSSIQRLGVEVEYLRKANQALHEEVQRAKEAEVTWEQVSTQANNMKPGTWSLHVQSCHVIRTLVSTEMLPILSIIYRTVPLLMCADSARLENDHSGTPS
jgi:FtsZ-binding cell division protein ZapB